MSIKSMYSSEFLSQLANGAYSSLDEGAEALRVGDEVVSADMPKDSNYTLIMGKIISIKNGWATVEATVVKDRWAKQPYKHPTSCMVSVKLSSLRFSGVSTK